MGTLTRNTAGKAPGQGSVEAEKGEAEEPSSTDLDQELEWDKDKLLDTLHWIRQLIGVVFGVLFGFLPVTGLVGAVLFAAISFSCTYLFYHSYLDLDEDDYGGHSVLLGEGFMPSFF